MAQGQLASVPPLANGTSLGLSRDELHQIQQYERIVQFRDVILAGSHSKIKVPAQLASQTPTSAIASSSNPSTPAKETNGSTAQGYQVGNPQSFATTTPQASLPGLGNPPPANANLPARPFVSSGKTEINPIFLQKSDDLIKAEIQLQRQRLERALRDEVDQRRASMKASAQSEPLADFDLSDVLSKALTLVQAAAPSSVNATLAAANISAASDSVDENSYYSSQVNSPDSSHRSSRGGKDAEVTTQTHKASTAGQPFEGQSQVQANQKAQAGLQSSISHASATHQPQGQASNSNPFQSRPVPSRPDAAPEFSRYPSVGTTQRTDRGDNTGLSTSGGGSGNTSRSEESGVMDLDDSADRSVPAAGQQQLRESMLARQPSPLIQVRAHNISPLAPQPSHVSPLAMVRGQAADAQDLTIPQGTTAQVAALRNEPNIISSPDSSPQGGRSGEKRKGKKKKNGKRAARQAPDELYIKPEPRSPSPMNAPSFIRPQKRQRRQGDEEPRYAQPERQFSRSYREEGAAPMYDAQEYRPRPASQAAAIGDYGYGREYIEEPRVMSGAEYVRHVPSPGVYAVHAAPSEVYATSPASVDRYGREPPRYYRDGYEVTRMSTRPMTDRARSRSPVMRERASPLMGPPKAPSGRVVVDPATGRRYYEPPTVVRQSVAPSPLRPAEPEVIYERAPIRAESRRPGPPPRDDDVLYQRTSPVYAAPRRVVTQPEYVSDPQRIYRQREYSTRPMAPPGEEFIPARGGMEQRRIIEEAQREYMMRATTARPAETAVRYELPREYGRVQSVRPEQIPIQDYASGSMHPDARREMIPPGPRPYSVRPAEPQVVRREYSARPVEQQPYYGQPVPARGEPEVSYIERPMYYTDEAPRPVYR